jgi:hypothetical protein
MSLAPLKAPQQHGTRAQGAVAKLGGVNIGVKRSCPVYLGVPGP